MRMLLAIVTISLLSCTSQLDPRTISGVNEEFIPYISLYVESKGARLNYNIPMQFGELSHDHIGRCISWSSGHRQVVISRKFWFNRWTTENQRISLIFHELGHCDLNRDHDDTILPSGWPKSLMHTYLYSFNDSMFDYYVQELFGFSNSIIPNEKQNCYETINNQ